MKIILASQSPRRKELLERMGITDFKVIPAQGEELATRTLTADQLVEELSQRKCAEVAAAHPKDLIIAADTVVSTTGCWASPAPRRTPPRCWPPCRASCTWFTPA